MAKFKTHRVIDVAACMYHSLAVTETGALYASGANDEGQIFADSVRTAPPLSALAGTALCVTDTCLRLCMDGVLPACGR